MSRDLTPEERDLLARAPARLRTLAEATTDTVDRRFLLRLAKALTPAPARQP